MLFSLLERVPKSSIFISRDESLGLFSMELQCFTLLFLDGLRLDHLDVCTDKRGALGHIRPLIIRSKLSRSELTRDLEFMARRLRARSNDGLVFLI